MGNFLRWSKSLKKQFLNLNKSTQNTNKAIRKQSNRDRNIWQQQTIQFDLLIRPPTSPGGGGREGTRKRPFSSMAAGHTFSGRHLLPCDFLEEVEDGISGHSIFILQILVTESRSYIITVVWIRILQYASFRSWSEPYHAIHDPQRSSRTFGRMSLCGYDSQSVKINIIVGCCIWCSSHWITLRFCPSSMVSPILNIRTR